MNVYALVRYEGDSSKIEVDARQTIDQVFTLFDGSAHPERYGSRGMA